MSSLDTLLERLARNIRTQEPSRESIASAIGIHDLVFLQGVDVEDLLMFRVCSRYYRGVLGTVGDDNNTGAGLVVLREGGNGLCDRYQVFRVGLTCSRCPSLGFSLVSNHNIGVGQDLLKLLSEELSNERRGKVQYEGLDIARSFSQDVGHSP